MVCIEDVYHAFGELMYAVALADGEIQQEEIIRFNKIIEKHQFAHKIKWSFFHEQEENTPLKVALEKALKTLTTYGPFEDLPFLFKALEEIALAFNGIVIEERNLIDNFRKDLHEQFKKDMRFSGY